MSPLFNSDQEWEALALRDPYWAVLTDERFRTANLTPETLAYFHATGEHFIATVWKTIETHLLSPFTPRRVLDFGCGVGRLLIPLARKSQEAWGVDVSEAMRKFAAQNAAEAGLQQVTLTAQLSELQGPFDLVHSYLVFQHIPPQRGLGYIRDMLHLLADGGVGVLHINLRNPPRSWRTRIWSLWMRLRGYPEISMFCYDLNEVINLLHSQEIRQCHIEFTNHGGHQGVLLFFRKSSDARYVA